MMCRGWRFFSRLKGLVALALTLVSATDVSAQLQTGELPASIGEKVIDMLREGRNLDAIALAKHLIETAPPSQRQLAFHLAARVCIVTLDVDCARHAVTIGAPLLQALPVTEVQASSVGYSLLLRCFVEVAEGNYQGMAKKLDSEFPIQLANPQHDPVLFAELHLLAARRSRLLGDFETSRDHLDKALAATLTLDSRFDAPRLIVRIATQLMETYDIERAFRLINAAGPLLARIPATSFVSYEYGQLLATLIAYGNDFTGARRALEGVLVTLGKLQLAPELTRYLASLTDTDVLVLAAQSGNHAGIRTLLQAHPLASTRESILARGYFANMSEFYFAVVEEFARLVLDDRSETGWSELLRMPPQWTSHPDQVRDAQAYGQAAVAFRRLRMGGGADAAVQMVEAAKKRLAVLQEHYRGSSYSSPLPHMMDRMLFDFAFDAAFAVSATPDYDFLLQAKAVRARSLATNADDALTVQAAQDSEEKKRIARSLRAIDLQRSGWETQKTQALAERMLSAASREADTIFRDRQLILSQAGDFTLQQQRLRVALAKGETPGGAPSVVTLAAVKQALRPDEALIFYVGTLGGLGKICIRADQTFSSTEDIDRVAATTDSRILRGALIATHPASNEADSQFPAAAAVRLGKIMLGGLEECLRRSRRIYFVSPQGLFEQVPPAVLLTEIPPAMGAGYDLRAAHWLVRDHAFVRTTSIDAFVATKRLSREKSATLDYLGVGDPVLSAQKGAALGSMPELPETSEEIERVSSLFTKAKVRTLRREAATEEALRLQPLSEFDVIHLATHGLVKEELPGLPEPSLVLTPRPASNAFNDGLLSGSQIAALPFRARLVVLSACNSARYEPSIIDSGVQGLSTSFAIAGVPTMIASLWPIESTLTRDLIVDTFRAARTGRDVGIADALATAMRRHLDGPTPRPLLHPRFWAALVVLGDGATTLDAAITGTSRDLGPFAAIDPSRDQEIVSASPIDGDLATSTIMKANGKLTAPLVLRRPTDGAAKWQVGADDISPGATVATTRVIYVAGNSVLPQAGTASGVPVLRGFSPNGTQLWSHRLLGPLHRTTIMGLAAAADQSALALVGPSIGSQDSADFTLIGVDASGAETSRLPLPLPLAGNAPASLSGYLTIDGSMALAALNRGPRRAEQPSGYDAYGRLEFCVEGDATDNILFDAADLKEQRRQRIEGFQVKSAVAVKDGWIVAGDVRTGCKETQPAAYKVGTDGAVIQIWRDASPFNRFARGIRKTAGQIEIVGLSRRSVSFYQEVSSTPAAGFQAMEGGSEANMLDDLFSVRLSEDGVEQRRDFVGAGLPIAPAGIVTIDERSVIFGSVGARSLWLTR
ncbi:hypothetical protein BH11PSE3_BH11PSE3_15710 [soil metagenome]